MLGTEQFTNAASHEWVSLLYTTAIGHCQQANQYLAQGSIDLAHVAFVQAKSVLKELMNTLDVDNDGAIASMLQHKYQDMHRRLQAADENQDTIMLQEVTKSLRQLAAIWRQMGALEIF